MAPSPLPAAVLATLTFVLAGISPVAAASTTPPITTLSATTPAVQTTAWSNAPAVGITFLPLTCPPAPGLIAWSEQGWSLTYKVNVLLQSSQRVPEGGRVLVRAHLYLPGADTPFASSATAVDAYPPRLLHIDARLVVDAAEVSAARFSGLLPEPTMAANLLADVVVEVVAGDFELAPIRSDRLEVCPVRLAPVPTVVPACRDAVGWMSNDGEPCAAFESQSYCTATGAVGTGWNPDWGLLADYGSDDGVLPTVACCACGGGSQVELQPGAQNGDGPARLPCAASLDAWAECHEWVAVARACETDFMRVSCLNTCAVCDPASLARTTTAVAAVVPAVTTATAGVNRNIDGTAGSDAEEAEGDEEGDDLTAFIAIGIVAIVMFCVTAVIFAHTKVKIEEVKGARQERRHARQKLAAEQEVALAPMSRPPLRAYGPPRARRTVAMSGRRPGADGEVVYALASPKPNDPEYSRASGLTAQACSDAMTEESMSGDLFGVGSGADEMYDNMINGNLALDAPTFDPPLRKPEAADLEEVVKAMSPITPLSFNRFDQLLAAAAEYQEEALQVAGRGKFMAQPTPLADAKHPTSGDVTDVETVEARDTGADYRVVDDVPIDDEWSEQLEKELADAAADMEAVLTVTSAPGLAAAGAVATACSPPARENVLSVRKSTV